MSLRYFAGSTPKSSYVASNHDSMPPCSTFAAASSGQRDRVRMQRVGVLVDEERQRNAPLPLARQRPVRPVRDHPVEPRLAPRGKELGALDAGERRLAQRPFGLAPR